MTGHISKTGTSNSSARAFKTLDMIEGLFDLLNEEINGPEWLRRFALLANCSSAAALWWHEGQLESLNVDSYGEAVPSDPVCLRYLEEIVTRAKPTSPSLLEDMVHQSNIDLDARAFSLLDEKYMVACMDWHPARAFLVFGGRDGDPNWNTTDRDRLRQILPLLHKSLSVKKKMSYYEDIIDLSNKFINEVPRGVITVMPDSKLLIANRLGSRLLREGKLIQLQDGSQVSFKDFAVQQEFNTQISSLMKLPDDKLDEYIWFKKLSGNNSSEDMLITFACFKLDMWKVESTPYDRVGVMVIETEHELDIPSEGQLVEFFKVSRAQARVIQELMQESSVEKVAERLNLSVNTVRSHLRSIYNVMGVNNKAQLLQRLSNTLRKYVRSSNPENDTHLTGKQK